MIDIALYIVSAYIVFYVLCCALAVLGAMCIAMGEWCQDKKNKVISRFQGGR
jgi:hypothetical protein